MNSLVRIRFAPSGKVYVTWNGRPICGASGGLLYFDTRDKALEFLDGLDATEILVLLAA
jgi:hypothetical protein